jgi:hypothetical protein
LVDGYGDGKTDIDTEMDINIGKTNKLRDRKGEMEL